MLNQRTREACSMISTLSSHHSLGLQCCGKGVFKEAHSCRPFYLVVYHDRRQADEVSSASLAHIRIVERQMQCIAVESM